MKRKTTQEFKTQAERVHDNKYDYSKTEYTNAQSKVVITCPAHGEFDQLPGNHLKGQGCPKCAVEKLESGYTRTTEEFIIKASNVHNNFYSYDKVDYSNTKSKVTITCPEHGDFEQKPNGHLSGQGCPKCKTKKGAESCKSSTKEFIEKANVVHKDYYNYSKVDYVNDSTKVTITCPVHGDFLQVPNNHLAGHGCVKCAISKRKEQGTLGTGWSYTSWETQGKISKDFEGFSLYLIECTSRSTGEKFLKVGKTFTSVAKRFNTNSAMPYMFKIINQVYHNAFAISKLEEAVKKEFKNYKYEPKKEFAGKSECLSMECLDKVLLFINDKEAYQKSLEQEDKE
jgi:hypothetical protein